LLGKTEIVMADILLEVRDLKKYYPVTKGLIFSKVIAQVKAVDGISFTVNQGDVFGIVGESGCGKTTTIKMILLLENITSGNILFDNKDISRLSRAQIKEYRSSVQAMFQDPYSSLNPTMKIGDFIAEPMVVNLHLTRKDIKERVAQMLVEVKLPPTDAELYPHEFSGGQRQRIALARAIGIRPKLVILDEPVSALDVSVRAQLMNLLMDIQRKLRLTYIIVAHDLAVVRHMSSRMAVMYLGKIVEYGDSEKIYNRRLHPYTQALLSAALPSNPDSIQEEIVLPGEVPSPINPPIGCHFHPRCNYSKEICREVEPLLESAEADHTVACHFWKDLFE
jgi:oligopeptide/dipeptide ABC transporter ATP-binding protein